MILDAFTQLSSAQALTASAASEDYISLQNPRDIGLGEPMAVVINWRVAAGGTSPTFAAAVQVDDNTGFSSATTVVTSKTLSGTTAMPAGAQLVIPLPSLSEIISTSPSAAENTYLRLNYTLGGTSPTMTVDAQIVPMSMIQNYRAYADAITIS